MLLALSSGRKKGLRENRSGGPAGVDAQEQQSSTKSQNGDHVVPSSASKQDEAEVSQLRSSTNSLQFNSVQKMLAGTSSSEKDHKRPRNKLVAVPTFVQWEDHEGTVAREAGRGQKRSGGAAPSTFAALQMQMRVRRTGARSKASRMMKTGGAAAASRGRSFMGRGGATGSRTALQQRSRSVTTSSSRTSQPKTMRVQQQRDPGPAVYEYKYHRKRTRTSPTDEDQHRKGTEEVDLQNAKVDEGSAKTGNGGVKKRLGDDRVLAVSASSSRSGEENNSRSSPVDASALATIPFEQGIVRGGKALDQTPATILLQHQRGKPPNFCTANPDRCLRISFAIAAPEYESAQLPLPLICHAKYLIYARAPGTVRMTSSGSPNSTTRLMSKFGMQDLYSC